MATVIGVSSISDRLCAALDSLPSLSEKDVPLNDACPICLIPFGTILKNQDAVVVRTEGEPSKGVTKLSGCGHLFCMNDLTEWIRNRHGTCPTCRDVFLDVLPPSESDDESSDGGEYLPDDSDEEDDAFPDDGDSEIDEEDMEFDADLVDAEARRDGFARRLARIDVDLDEGSEEEAEEDWEDEEELDADAFFETNLSASPSENDTDPEEIELEIGMLSRAGAGPARGATPESATEVFVAADEETHKDEVTPASTQNSSK